jgi:hypothetical protein
LTYLTSVRQSKEELVSDYRCFNLSLTNSDLTDLAARGLRPAIRDRLEGVEFHTLTNVLVRGMAQELKLNKEKEHSKPRRSNVHMIEILIVQTTRMKCTLLNLCGLQNPKLVLVHLLSRLLKVGKKN